MPSRDLAGSRAVLIGTADYIHLPPVPAAGNSLARMGALLTGPLCGWPVDRVSVIDNWDSPGNLHDQLIEVFSDTDPDGVALFYYVGHGQPDEQDRLCLGLVGSRTEHHRRASTSLRFDDVRGALVACEARTKIVMLDCCFAGLAARSRQSLSGTDVLDMVRGAGAYTMAASGAYLPAWFETDAAKPQTYFTKYFVDVVESGIEGEPAGLTLDRVFAETHARLGRDGKPEPTHTARHEAGRTVFARNAAPVEEQVDLGSRIAQLEERLRTAEAEVAALRGKAEETGERMRAVPDSAALVDEAMATVLRTAEAEARRAEAAEELYGLRAIESPPGHFVVIDNNPDRVSLMPERRPKREKEPSPVLEPEELAGLQEAPAPIPPMRLSRTKPFRRPSDRRKTVGRYAVYLPLAFVLGLPLLRFGSASPLKLIVFVASAAALGLLAWRLRIRITDRPEIFWYGSAVLLTWAQVAALVLGAATGYLVEPVGVAVRFVLTWGF